jgi:hypothetical protein
MVDWRDALETKVNTVIDSCTTIEQARTADKYVELAFRRNSYVGLMAQIRLTSHRLKLKQEKYL